MLFIAVVPFRGKKENGTKSEVVVMQMLPEGYD
jgi:hypothetical protein